MRLAAILALAVGAALLAVGVPTAILGLGGANAAAGAYAGNCVMPTNTASCQALRNLEATAENFVLAGLVLAFLSANLFAVGLLIHLSRTFRRTAAIPR